MARMRSGAALCAGCGRGCHSDHSSRAPRLPSLAMTGVMEEILREAARKTLLRAAAAERGEMTPNELAQADRRLSEWLTDTLSGLNPHFSTTERWNPDGLAAYLEENFSAPIEGALGWKPRSRGDFVGGAVRMLLAEIWLCIRASGAFSEQVSDIPGLEPLVMRWAGIFTGIPVS